MKYLKWITYVLVAVVCQFSHEYASAEEYATESKGPAVAPAPLKIDPASCDIIGGGKERNVQDCRDRAKCLEQLFINALREWKAHSCDLSTEQGVVNCEEDLKKIGQTGIEQVTSYFNLCAKWVEYERTHPVDTVGIEEIPVDEFADSTLTR